jgi:hypothetical protein
MQDENVEIDLLKIKLILQPFEVGIINNSSKMERYIYVKVTILDVLSSIGGLIKIFSYIPLLFFPFVY